jgi:hypothetical protein
MTQYPEIFNRLSEQFQGGDIKILNKGGKQMRFITARTAMNRLDDVLGPENWWDEYVPGDKSVLCKLTIRLPEGEILTKQDAGGYAGMADEGDDDKSGYSDAFKRACVKFGVARYLYGDGVPIHKESGEEEGPVPAKPAPATVPTPAPAAPTPNPDPPRQQDPSIFKLPTTGLSAYRWLKIHGDHFKTDVLAYATDLAEAFGYGRSCKAWNPQMVREICMNAVKYMTVLPVYKQEFAGHVDVSKMNFLSPDEARAESQEAETEKMDLEKSIINTIRETLKIQRKREPERQEIRGRLDVISALANDSKGVKSNVVESLAECTDYTWMRNMLDIARRDLDAANASIAKEQAY